MSPVQPLVHVVAQSDQSTAIGPRTTLASDRSDFDFRSSFWLNLHQFLYLQAVLATPEAHAGRAEVAARDAAGALTMSGVQNAARDQVPQQYTNIGPQIASLYKTDWPAPHISPTRQVACESSL